MLYVTDAGADTVFRVNPKTGGVHPVVSIASESYGVAAASNRTVYMTAFFAGTVSRVNVKTGHVAPVASGLINPIG